MARRRLLSDEQMAPFWAWASDEREIVRHYTLSAADIKLVARTPPGPIGSAVRRSVLLRLLTAACVQVFGRRRRRSSHALR